jgi:hypothetical protein
MITAMKQGNNIIVFSEQNFQKVFDMVLLNQQIQYKKYFDFYMSKLLARVCFFVVKFVSILLVFGYVFYNVDVENFLCVVYSFPSIGDINEV